MDWCSYTPSNAASYLTKVMHDRDGSTGLWFTSKDGNRWFGYGDAQFFISDNIKNQDMASTTLQSSVNQIFVAYNNRDVDQSAKSAIIDSMMEEMNQKLPDLDKIANDPENKPAIFKVVDKEVLTYDASAKKYVHLNCWKALTSHAIWGL